MSEKRKRGRRSVSCRDVLLRSFVLPLSRDAVESLDSIDTSSRSAAQRLGKSHPKVSCGAKRRLEDITLAAPPKVRIRVAAKTSYADVLVRQRDAVGVESLMHDSDPKRRRV